MTEQKPAAASPGQATASNTLEIRSEQDDDRPLWQRLGHDRWGEGGLGTLLALVVLVISVVFCGFQLMVAVGGTRIGEFRIPNLDAYQLRVYHLAFVLALVFLVRPAGSGRWAKSPFMGVVDLALVAVAVVVGLYPVVFFDEIIQRTGNPSVPDLVMGTVMLVLLMEAARRTIGSVMAVLAGIFLCYAWLGPLLPGVLSHRGYTFQRIVYHSYLFQEGIYGVALGVAATFVFIFIFFGALLQKTGGGNFFIGLAYALTGRYTGGPAKGAVVGSAMMGSISGSAIANTVTTGAFTIPLMRRVGYKRHEAGGVEAAASTGGQVLPPIMGAGAFVMAEFTGIPYTDILLVAIIPAVMYFVVVFLFVDIIARKHGIRGLGHAELPRFGQVLRDGGQFILPFVLLVVLLLNYVSPLRAGLYGVAALFLVAMLRAATRLNPTQLAEVFVLAARNALSVTVACAAAGIIVGVVSLTGLGLTISSIIVGAGGGTLLLTLFMVALASLILGMGLPVTAAYIVLSVLAVPALGELGLAVLTAHMIVYWFSQSSNVTPPIALAAFSAAGIAGSNPMRTALSSFRFAKGLFLIPVLMAYSPLLLDGSPPAVLWTVASGSAALCTAVIALEGYFLRRTLLVERILFAGAAVLAFVPVWWLQLPGIVLGVGLIAAQFIGRETVPKTKPSSQTVTTGRVGRTGYP